MPKISVIVHTASNDDFLKDKGVDSYFKQLVINLNEQTFTDFELIYVDAHYEENQIHHDNIQMRFPLKHVPIHPNHRYWFDRGNFFISAAKNTGIIHSRGELLVSFDDAEFFPSHLLQLYWDTYRRSGKYLIALHKRWKQFKSQEYITDHRFKDVKGYKDCKQNWTYAGTSFGLKDALELNGFNERMDGYKALEDCEFGIRLSKLGRKFALHEQGYLYILDHSVSYKREAFRAVENHGMLECAKRLSGYRANEGQITDKQISIIKQETLKYRKFDPNKFPEQLTIWKNTPTFDLAKEWEEKNNDQSILVETSS